MIGQTIAHNTITEKIGQGGMGEVYRATATKLKRDGALKILPESFARPAEDGALCVKRLSGSGREQATA